MPDRGPDARTKSLGPQHVDRVLLGRTPRRIGAEDHAHERRDQQRSDDVRQGGDGRHFRILRDDGGESEAESDA